MSYAIYHTADKVMINTTKVIVRNGFTFVPSYTEFKSIAGAKSALTRHIAKWNKIANNRLAKYGMDYYTGHFGTFKILIHEDYTITTIAEAIEACKEKI